MSENLEKRIRSRSIQKHDLEINWNKATSFIPYKGEFIIYDIEVDKDGNTLEDAEGKLLLPEGRTAPYTYERIKLGDGKTKVSELPFIDNTSLKYIEQELTEAQKVQARANIDAALANDVVKLSAQTLTAEQKNQVQTNLDVYPTSQAVGYNSIIQNTNPFGGKRLYINSLDNAFAGFTKKYWVCGTYHKIKDIVDGQEVTYPHVKEGAEKTDPDYWVDGPLCSSKVNEQPGGDNMAALFDNDYEGGLRIPVGYYLKIHMRFSNEENWNPQTAETYHGYPYGTFYISYYDKSIPSKTRRSQFRCYNTFAAHGIGWKQGTFKYNLGDATSDSNVMESYYNDGAYGRTCMEFIIFSPDTPTDGSTAVQTGPVCLEWKQNRPNFSTTTPLLHNYKTNSMYQIINFKKRTERSIDTTLKLSPDGYVEANNYIKGQSVLLTTADKIYGLQHDQTENTIRSGFGIINSDYTFTFNENESVPIATREEFDDSWENNAIFIFDKATKSFKYSGKTLESYKKEIQDEMKAYMAKFVAEYVENYMSQETIVYPDGTTETNSDILYVNGTTTEIRNEDSSTTLYVEEE